VDGCFWHGCPIHAIQPKQNAEFWRTKIARNQARDRLVTRTLRARGWCVIRLWQHVYDVSASSLNLRPKYGDRTINI